MKKIKHRLGLGQIETNTFGFNMNAIFSHVIHYSLFGILLSNKKIFSKTKYFAYTKLCK